MGRDILHSAAVLAQVLNGVAEIPSWHSIAQNSYSRQIGFAFAVTDHNIGGKSVWGRLE